MNQMTAKLLKPLMKQGKLNVILEDLSVAKSVLEI